MSAEMGGEPGLSDSEWEEGRVSVKIYLRLSSTVTLHLGASAK